MTRLLVSVRSAAEAEIALAGGAALIDVKEPANGPLGMAPLTVIEEVVRVVAGRVPVSAALGEVRDAAGLPSALAERLAFVKYGTAGFGDRCRGDWERAFSAVRQRLMGSPFQVVVAAYADWRRAESPIPSELCDFACEHQAGPFLLDTWVKDGSTLLDWLSLAEVAELCDRCRAAGVPIALAGSLGPAPIRELLPLEPDWVAVRGAACAENRRDKPVNAEKVRGLAELVRTLRVKSCAG